MIIVFAEIWPTDVSFSPAVARNSEVLASNSVRDVCHRRCVYTVLQPVQRNGMCSAVYGTAHWEEPLKSFDNSMAYSRLRPSFCRDIAIPVVGLWSCSAKTVYIRFQANVTPNKIPLKFKYICGKCSVNQIIQFWRCLFFINNVVFIHLKLAIAFAIPA